MIQSSSDCTSRVSSFLLCGKGGRQETNLSNDTHQPSKNGKTCNLWEISSYDSCGSFKRCKNPQLLTLQIYLFSLYVSYLHNLPSDLFKGRIGISEPYFAKTQMTTFFQPQLFCHFSKSASSGPRSLINNTASPLKTTQTPYACGIPLYCMAFYHFKRPNNKFLMGCWFQKRPHPQK